MRSPATEPEGAGDSSPRCDEDQGYFRDKALRIRGEKLEEVAMHTPPAATLDYNQLLLGSWKAPFNS
jgi:hypothetical protein